jgi:hypothetical protein
MKNIIKVLGIVAVIAMIAFLVAACASLGGMFTDLTSGPEQKDYKVGDTGPGGGIVFYVKNNDNDGWRYLEAAPADIEGTFAWIGESWTTTHRVDLGSADWEIGKGKRNTATILSVDPNAPASKACVDYRGGRFDDWFLPSRDEFVEMFKQNSILNLTAEYYWTSTEFRSQFGQNLSTVYNTKEKREGGFSKGLEWGVRPVRAFLTSKQGAPAALAYVAPPPETAPEPVRVRFEPAANQPSPAGVWKGSHDGYGTYTFNANGTGNRRYFHDTKGWETNDLKWSVSGNRLTLNYTDYATVYIYEITGGTLKWVDSQWPYDPVEYTRQ